MEQAKPNLSRPRWSVSPLLVIAEWLLVFPSAVLVAAAALRDVTPHQFEPGRTSSLIFGWAAAHISPTGAAVIFLALPTLVILVGCAALLRTWHSDVFLREDTAALAMLAWRQKAVAIAAAATLLGGAILAMVVVHLIVG